MSKPEKKPEVIGEGVYLGYYTEKQKVTIFIKLGNDGPPVDKSIILQDI